MALENLPVMNVVALSGSISFAVLQHLKYITTVAIMTTINAIIETSVPDTTPSSTEFIAGAPVVALNSEDDQTVVEEVVEKNEEFKSVDEDVERLNGGAEGVDEKDSEEDGGGILVVFTMDVSVVMASANVGCIIYDIYINITVRLREATTDILSHTISKWWLALHMNNSILR